MNCLSHLARASIELILRHRKDLETKRETNTNKLKFGPRWLEATSTAAGPKTRLVDGTPEYSFHICGLRKLFPDASFIHILRDVESVVRSMLNFHRATGIHLVPNGEEAYRSWLGRSTRASAPSAPTAQTWCAASVTQT